MSGIQRGRLADGTDIIWAVPLSGMGHVADEQPLPFLQRWGTELTPRFGGEECFDESGLASLPMPYGYLAAQWPWRQRLFNLPRRRINIYWRNFFSDATRKDRLFHFIEQLKFREINHGFEGNSPVLKYRRLFYVRDNAVEVNDTIEFKINLQFSELYLCPWAEFQESEEHKKCKIETTLVGNCSRPIKSSSGAAWWHAHKLSNVHYKKGNQLTWRYEFHSQ